MNYIIIATSNAIPKKREYLASSRRNDFTLDLNEACRFVQEQSAIDAIKVLIGKNLERKLNVKFSYARVETKIVDEFDVTPKDVKPAKPGFIIELDGARYHSAARKPKAFHFGDAYYKVTPNIDKATRFATYEEAMARIGLCEETLDSWAKSQKSDVYMRIAQNFSAKIKEV